jgi:hypothetical protein
MFHPAAVPNGLYDVWAKTVLQNPLANLMAILSGAREPASFAGTLATRVRYCAVIVKNTDGRRHSSDVQTASTSDAAHL